MRQRAIAAFTAALSVASPAHALVSGPTSIGLCYRSCLMIVVDSDAGIRERTLRLAIAERKAIGITGLASIELLRRTEERLQTVNKSWRTMYEAHFRSRCGRPPANAMEYDVPPWNSNTEADHQVAWSLLRGYWDGMVSTKDGKAAWISERRLTRNLHRVRRLVAGCSGRREDGPPRALHGGRVPADQRTGRVGDRKVGLAGGEIVEVPLPGWMHANAEITIPIDC